MLRKVLSFIDMNHMVEVNDHIIVGVSGGADSVCLLKVLCQLKEEKEIKISVVHVEHGIRGKESEQDAMFVKVLCEKWNVPCITYYCKAKEHAAENKMTVEESARFLRYHYFSEAMKQQNATKVAVAHNQNDNAETVLFHLARGTGLKGLCGILPVRDQIIRPLLCVSREEIEKYLLENEIIYCTDQTNFEIEYSRNKIRHKIIPVLEEINEKTVNHISEASEFITQSINLMEKCKKEAMYQLVTKTDDVIEINESLKNELPIIENMILYSVLEEVASSSKNIEKKHILMMSELFFKPVGKILSLPYRITAKRTYKGICIRQNLQSIEKSYQESITNLLKINEKMELPEYGYCIMAKIRNIENLLSKEGGKLPKFEKNKYTKSFDYDKIKVGVQLRTRQQGDYIVIDKLGKKQKLKNYFINEKINKEQRDHILLLADGAHILWIVGYRISEEYKITEHTNRILEIHIDGGKLHE